MQYDAEQVFKHNNMVFAVKVGRSGSQVNFKPINLPFILNVKRNVTIKMHQDACVSELALQSPCPSQKASMCDQVNVWWIKSSPNLLFLLIEYPVSFRCVITEVNS